MTPETTTPQEEARSLRENPLPLMLTEDDEDLPTRIYQVEDHIRILQTELQRLTRTREDLMNRALEVNALEDDFCQIQFKERQTRILDSKNLHLAYPQETGIIIERLVSESLEKIKRIGEHIPLGLADAIIGKDKVTAICEIRVERTPYVVRRDAP